MPQSNHSNASIMQHEVDAHRLGQKKMPGNEIASGHRFQSEQVHDPLREALLAQHYVQLAIAGDLLQDLQFPEPHQRRVAFQQLGRVDLTAHGRCLLAAGDLA